ncbi:9572_t:CDS:2, partial [Racocetra fulgida]
GTKLYFLGGWSKNSDGTEGCQNSVFYLDLSVSFDTQGNIPWTDLTTIAGSPVNTCWQVSALAGPDYTSIYAFGGVMIDKTSPTLSEKTDPDSEKSSSIISPIEDNDHHGSIELAIKSIEEQLKLQQQKFAKRLLSQQHRPVEYRDDISANSTVSSEQGSNGKSRSEPVPFSYGKSEPIPYSHGRGSMSSKTLAAKKAAPKPVAQIKNICTCGDPNSPWCHVCELRRFKSGFPKWTSGNKIVDNFIKETQLNCSSEVNYLEWISYDRFREVKEIGHGAYAKLFSAIWLDGPRIIPDEKKKFKRDVRKRVILRQLHNSQNISESFFSEDPATKNFIMVFENVENGNLHTYLNENIINMSWQSKLAITCDLVKALKTIHHVDIIHHDIHSGNVMVLKNGFIALADLGLCRKVDDSDEDGKVQCILPYAAPEVILRKEFSKASDIYSFAMIMWEISVGKRPFNDRAHDAELALEICNGLRPPIDNTPSTPPCWNALMEQCWDKDPLKRPDAIILHRTLCDWLKKIVETPRLPYKVNTEFALAENWRSHKVHSHTSQENEQIHPLAFYTSQSFDFSELQSSQLVRCSSPDVINTNEVDVINTNEVDVKYDTQDDVNTLDGVDGVDEIDTKYDTPNGVDVKDDTPDDVDIKCNTPPSETENTFEPPQSPTGSNSKTSEIEIKYDGTTSPSGESATSFKADQSEHLEIEF